MAVLTGLIWEDETFRLGVSGLISNGGIGAQPVANANIDTSIIDTNLFMGHPELYLYKFVE